MRLIRRLVLALGMQKIERQLKTNASKNANFSEFRWMYAVFIPFIDDYIILLSRPGIDPLLVATARIRPAIL
jgi:hypothetical protein